MSIFLPSPIRSLSPLRRSGAPIDTAPNPVAARAHRLGDEDLHWARLAVPAAVVVLALLGRLWFLQIVQGQTYRQRADVNRVRTISLPAPRGILTDIRGRVVADNIPNFILAVLPADLPRPSSERTAALVSIAKLSGLPVSEVERRLHRVSAISTEPLSMREEIPNEEALDLMVQTADQPWMLVFANPARHYPFGTATAHVLGYIGAITAEDLVGNPNLSRNRPIGKAGLEQKYNQLLTGQDGYRDIERNVSHQAQQVLAQQDPKSGTSLQLTIDADLQQHLYDALGSSIQRVHAKAGAAVALDPRTGAVRALLSFPGYDDNAFVASHRSADVTAVLQDSRRPLLNRAIGGQYPSGSIIKPMLAAAGLQEGIVTPSTIIQSTGGITIGRDNFPDWKPGGHGPTNLAKAIAESVNTYFYLLGGGDEHRPGLGVDQIVKYLSEFGWGSRLGLDLPGEVSGLLPTRTWRSQSRLSPWRLGDTYHLSIGQGDLLVTPLQIASAISAIVNNGTVYRPYLVEQIGSTPPKRVSPTVLQRVDIEPQYFAAVRDGMRQGVLTGSSKALNSLPVPTGAKTGTAQFGREGKTHAWFTAFAPYDNPELVIVVLVEGGGEGHVAALPVAQEALQWYFSKEKPVDNSLTGS